MHISKFHQLLGKWQFIKLSLNYLHSIDYSDVANNTLSPPSFNDTYS